MSPRKLFWIKRHDDKAVVILKHPFECQLLGTVKISVLSGSIKVLGARLSANGQWHNLYSPSSHMLLKLTTEHPTGNDVSQAKATLSAMFSDTDCYSDLINPSVVVLLVCDMNWGFSDYISTVCPYQRLFQAPPPEAHKFPWNKILKPFGISFFDTSKLITSRTTPEIDKFFTKWPRILKDFDSPQILVCGNKNTGKSTFSQILLNMALESRKAVCFLDCDPGQTEFTPPGCISLSVIKQFVLGPPFCHQQDPAFNIFFGEVSPNKNCNHYLMCVWNALQYYWSLPERFPLIVNTMGWVTGMGKNLLDGILNMLGPNHVVLLNSLKNACCPTDFSPDSVMQNPWNFPGDSEDNPTTSSCCWELTVLESVVSQDIISKSKLTSAELRNLSMLSYLGKTWSPGVSLNHNIPFKVKWTSLAIYVCQEFVPLNQILYAINASVVALCIADLNQAYHPNNDENFPMTFYKKPICKCVGFGFVRGIHAGSQMLYIVSPLPLSIISQVNTLLRGTIHLPLDKMQTQDVTDLKYVDKMLTKTMASRTNKKRRVLPKKKF